ncbi:MAG: aminoacetone oxidase family FAD-binding enzyme, partial [Desulfobulbaceae bacterium]|nr:aminoacetone oxidase family FAD-binding enzyme [Desulfobulbaceae bacterium]
MSKQRIIVIGGGAAGMMAAGQAAAAGAKVILLEKMNRPGRKLAITGKGRCNLTNIAEMKEFIDHFGPNGRFLRQAFSSFFAPELMVFLEQLGLELVSERGGRVFPSGGKAPEVVKAFQKWLLESGVQIKTTTRVELLLTTNGRISGVLANNETLPCDAVILATGGASYAATGSSGDGYRLASALGHTIVPIRPALVPLEIAGSLTTPMDGLDLRNINVRLLVNGKRCRQEFGEMSFTKFGVTGPVILTLSGDVVDGLRSGNSVSLSIDLKPALDEQKLEARLLRDLETRNKEQMSSVLRGLLPR